MIKEDINELLEYSLDQITELKKNDKVSKVVVKNILENLRSSLEYCAQYINQNLLLRQNKIYFPYGKNKENFEKSIERNFNNLEITLPNIYLLIEELQPHKSQDNWLILMCEATNEAKHNKGLDITDHTEREVILKNLKVPGIEFKEGINNYNNLNLRMVGCTLNGEQIDDFHTHNGNVEIMKKGQLSLQYNFEIKENKIFILNNYQCNLFELLEKSHLNILNFFNSIM